MNDTQQNNVIDYTDKYRQQIHYGKIVSVLDPQNPIYVDELFLVIGFQKDLYGYNDLIAIMDHKGRVFLTDIENLIVKSDKTIEDMFPEEPTDIMWLVKKNDV